MKKNLTLSLLSLILLITIFGCKKKDSAESPVTLNGSWELRNVLGLQVQGADPNYTPGNGNIFVFSEGNFKKYANGKLVDSGSYTIQKEEVKINNNASNYSMLLNNKTKLYLKIADRTLVIFDGVIAADGYEATYERQNLQL